MAFTSTITVSISGVGGGGTWPLSFVFPQNANSPLKHDQVAVINGNTTLTPPANALQLFIQPPSGSTVTKTLKGIGADSGIPIHASTPTLLSFPTTPGTLVLACNGAETVDIYWF